MSAEVPPHTYPKSLRDGALRAVSAVAETLFPEGVAVRLWGKPSTFARVFIVAGMIPIALGIVSLALAPRSGAPHWHTWAALCEVDALFGLVAGCILALHATRDYLLGIAGVAVSLFAAIILGALAGVTLYAASRAGTLFGYPSTSSGVPHISFYPSIPSWALHIFAGVAFAGLLAALLLVPTPWSPHRKKAAPLLVVVAVASSGLVLWMLPSAHATMGNIGTSSVLGVDPLLVVASLAGLFAVPLVVAGSIDWVSFCVRVGSRIAHSRRLARRSGVTRTVLVAAEAAWLGFGVAGRLPPWLGGHLGAWDLVRDAHPDAWLLVVILTGLGALFVASVSRPLDFGESASASHVPAALLYYASVAAGVGLFDWAAKLVVDAVMPSALPAIIVSAGAFTLGVATLWMRRRDHPVALPLAAAGACCLAILAGGLLWPIRVLPVLAEPPFARVEEAVGTAFDSAGLLAATAGFAGLVCVGAWLAWLAYTHYSPTIGLDGSPTRASGYEAVVLPLGCWLLVLAGAAVLRMTNGVQASAFTPLAVPDPALFAVAAFPVAAFTAVRPRSEHLGRIGVTVLLALPMLAFLPFALPAAVGPAGRLAVLAVVAPIAWAVVSGSRRFSSGPAGERALCWLVGTTAVTVPLLAYLVVAAGQPVGLTSLLTDNGQSGAGFALGAHLRLVLLLPLFVALVSSKPTARRRRSRPAPRAERRGTKRPTKQPERLPPSRWRDFQADVLIMAVRDHDLDSVYLDELRRQLAAMSPEQRARYALALAGRLYRSYPRLNSSARQAQQSTASSCGYPPRTSVKRALDVARRLHGQKSLRASTVSDARNQIAGQFAVPDGKDRSARRAFDAVEALRLALADPGAAPQACLDSLVTASRHEIEDAAEKLIDRPQHSKAFDHDLARARETIGQQFLSLQQPVLLDPLRLKFLWPAPSLVLGEPGAGQGVTLPVRRPYLILSIALVMAAVFAVLAYLYTVLSVALVFGIILMLAGAVAALIYFWR